MAFKRPRVSEALLLTMCRWRHHAETLHPHPAPNRGIPDSSGLDDHNLTLGILEGQMREPSVQIQPEPPGWVSASFLQQVVQPVFCDSHLFPEQYNETMPERRIPNTVQISLRAAYFTVFVTAPKLACVAVGANIARWDAGRDEQKERREEVKTITAASCIRTNSTLSAPTRGLASDVESRAGSDVIEMPRKERAAVRLHRVEAGSVQGSIVVRTRFCGPKTQDLRAVAKQDDMRLGSARERRKGYLRRRNAARVDGGKATPEFQGGL
ncbi:hypothetical protein DFH08DRAFT_816258 [Mycena albidolilacea]|uniref:Uncharacterized protein n=1 Tax=Mycena albidolilacea TaxID=1033008 RepID=A0AAD6ZMF1_9AGAR|nr:hypothetical protein DFH08DRAFT_816258 [Mycena albidolilacea]